MTEWLSWRRQPPERWSSTSFRGRHDKRNAKRILVRDQPKKYRRRKVPLPVIIAQWRHDRGSQMLGFAKKRLLRKLGLRHKRMHEYTPLDLIRIGAASSKEFNHVV